jgi:hypothetical protein
MCRNQPREACSETTEYSIKQSKSSISPKQTEWGKSGSDAHGHYAKQLLELFGGQEGVALALDVVDASPVGSKANFSNDGRAIGGKDKGFGSVSEEPPKDFRKAYRAILIEPPGGREKFIDVHLGASPNVSPR